MTRPLAMGRYGRIAIVRRPGDFPDVRTGPGDFPVAVGVALTPELMLGGYQRGIFAWSDEPVAWWSPDPRAVMPLDGFHVSRSLARTLRQDRFEVTVDQAFAGVVRGCATGRYPGDATWISPRFAACFDRLFASGHAHSVECWSDGQLAGGVFGVSIGGYFSAESMFHRVTDASKVALYYLVEVLGSAGFGLLDIQVLTPHTRSLGGVDIPRDAYLDLLARALLRTPRPIRR